MGVSERTWRNAAPGPRVVVMTEMPTSPDLHESLGELIGLAQAVRRIVRAIVASLDAERDRELVEGLEQLVVEISGMQGRCDSAIAGHAHLKPGRITDRAREIKAAAMRSVRHPTNVPELITALALVVQQALTGWRELDALASAHDHPPISELITSAIRLHEHHRNQLARRTVPSPLPS